MRKRQKQAIVRCLKESHEWIWKAGIVLMSSDMTKKDGVLLDRLGDLRCEMRAIVTETLGHDPEGGMKPNSKEADR